jgi:Subtilase family
MVLEASYADRVARLPQTYNEAALVALGVGGGEDQASRARVAIGFVDYGFDLLHPCLRTVDGHGSRFKYIWDQNRTPNVETDGDLDLGKLEDWDRAFLDDEIGAAATSGSRRALDLFYDPHANTGGRGGAIGGAHGTMMASMAAGTPFAGFRGAAPGAELIGVQLALLDHHWKEEDCRGRPTWLDWSADAGRIWSGGRSYNAAPQIISAARYIYDRSCRLGVGAVVINLSIGAWAGAHDGSSPVEAAIADLLARADAAHQVGRGPRTIIVAGAGNAGTDEGHWAATLPPDGRQSVDWVMQRRDPTQNKLEIWYEAAGQSITASLGLPDGTALTLQPGATLEIASAGVWIGIADHRLAVHGGLSCLHLLIHPPLLPPALFDGAAETLAFTISLANGTRAAIRAHAWVERDDGANERSWLQPSDANGSLCCLATIPGAIVVGGYDHQADGMAAVGKPNVLPVSSMGPAPWINGHRGQLPHFVAPARGIWGARSKSRGFTQATGTSAAVALTSGAIAAHLAREGAHATLPRASGPWNSRFGYGPFHI